MASIAGVEVDERRLAEICERYGIAELQVLTSSIRSCRACVWAGRSRIWRTSCPMSWVVRWTWCPGVPCIRCSARVFSRRLGPCMRDVLCLTEMIDAADQARRLADGITAADLEQNRQRRDALLWNFTVLGEAAARLSEETKVRFRTSSGSGPRRCETGSCTATCPMELEILYTTATEHRPESGSDLRRWLPAPTTS